MKKTLSLLLVFTLLLLTACQDASDTSSDTSSKEESALPSTPWEQLQTLSDELSAIYDCAHGAGLAVVMPAVFTYNMNHNVMRFAQAAVRVWGCQMDFEHPERTAKAGIEALRSFLISIGMPKNFAELGAKEEDIERMAHTACHGDTRQGTIGGFVSLNQQDVESIYRLML